MGIKVHDIVISVTKSFFKKGGGNPQGRALGKAWKAFHRSNDIYVQYNCSHNSLAKNLSICVPLLDLPKDI